MPVHLIYLVEWFESRFKMVGIAFGNKFENGFEVKEKKEKEIGK